MYRGKTIFTLDNWGIHELDGVYYLIGEVEDLEKVGPVLIKSIDFKRKIVNTEKTSYKLGVHL